MLFIYNVVCMKNINVLLTGASGFVGKQVLKNLENNKIQITVIARNHNNDIYKNNKSVKSIIQTDDAFKEQPVWWENACKNIDIFINLAWYAEPGKYLDSPLNTDCFNGTVNMIKGAAKAGIKRFVGIGTCFEYKFSRFPLETSSPLDPQTPYAKAKVDTFQYLEKFCKVKKIELLWCRLFYLYGEGEDERRLVPYIRKTLSLGKKVKLTSGEKVKDYLDIKEAGRIIANLAINKHKGAYNVCSGKGVSIKDLAENIADEYNGSHLLHFDSHERTSYDPPYIVGKKTDINF